ncbi:MAG: menaquinone biosynthesis decarboxylase [Mucinivorans sp.]
MYKNLKEYIAALEDRGDLVRITTRVDPELEMSEIIDRECKTTGGGRALLFQDTGTDFAVLANSMGSASRMALALGVDDLDAIGRSIGQMLAAVQNPSHGVWGKLKLLPIFNRARRWFPRHSSSKGECQQVVWLGADVDLTRLPILRTWPLDGGRFVTLPLVHTIDPDTKAHNVGMYRMQVVDKTTSGMHWQMHKTGARHYDKYAARGLRMPVAVCLGGDPAYTYAATAPLPEGVDEYLLAGFLRGCPVRLVRCVTNELEVPSDVDFVIEGYVDPAEEKFMEGPFGDHTGFYSLEDRYPLFHVTCITHRRGAIYPATLVGVPPMEDRYLALATEKIFLEPIKLTIAPEVTGLYMPWQGVAHNAAVVEIKKSYVGQGFKVAAALWGAGQMSFCKYIIITQSIASFKEQWRDEPWVICGEVLLTSGVADVLDHAGETMGRGGKMCVDTTSERATRRLISPIFDSGVDLLNDDERLWIALGNTDPDRDVKLTADEIIIDARSKTLAQRDFPNIVTMDDQTIEKVDRRWTLYNIGDFRESPSRRYKHLIKGNNAEQTKNG